MKRIPTVHNARQPKQPKVPPGDQTTDDFLDEYRAKVAAEPDFDRCLQRAWFAASSAVCSLAMLEVSLSRADTFVTQQPLPLAEAQSLVFFMRRLRETMRTIGPIVETWDESRLCLNASHPTRKSTSR